MIDLIGSPRQIAWAGQIRAQEIKQLRDEIARNNARIAEIISLDRRLRSGSGDIISSAETLVGQNCADWPGKR